MTAVLANGVLTAVTALGGLLVPLAVVFGVVVFAVLLVTSVRPVRRAPARMRLPRVAVALPVAQIAGAEAVGVRPLIAETVALPVEDERST